MQVNFLATLVIVSVLVSGCGSNQESASNDTNQVEPLVSGSLSKDAACRELKIAIGTYTDITLKSLSELELDENAKPRPPSQEIQTLVSALVESLNLVSKNTADEEVSNVGEQFATDIGDYHKRAMNQEISLAATAAITDDLTRIQSLCPAY